MENKVRVIIDSPVKNADIIYSSGFYCHDPFVFIDTGENKIGFLPSTEIEKAKVKSSIDIFYNMTDELKRIKEAGNLPPLKSSLVIIYLNEINVHDIFVPESFPYIEAENLKNHGINIFTYQDPFYQQRISKTKDEIEIVRDNCSKNNQVMNKVKEILQNSSISNDRVLIYKGEILTVEKLQNIIYKAFVDYRLYTDTIITAIGDQGVFPHESGHGEVKADTSIIVDIYPRSRDNLYYTDMTRTFCKGKASNDLKKVYKAVLDAQRFAMDKIRANIKGSFIHELVSEYFANKGFGTGILNGVLQGFFHGTGHGLGLDCHEMPYISSYGNELPVNSIVSVEPGLYYIGSACVRIEDLVVVTENGIENLTNYEKFLESE